MDKYIGRLLDNRYEILEVIGTGGMAVVYKARCHRLNRLVAIKILKDDYLQDEEFRRRFHAESQAVAMLSHPNIVAVYDVSTSDEADYIVMELIDGISLKQYMEKKGVLNWKETLHFAIQIAKALEHAHSRGIVHRDIKPHNVMVLKNGSVKVADFGIARLMSKGNTLTKEALGSVHYISPEQAKGGRVDNRSDIYSLGVVMYEMMSGRPPYDGESPVAVAIQHINGGAIMPSILNPNIPGGLEQIIMKAMAHDITDRYSSASAMLHDMDEFRKDPTILFDYNAPPLDDVTKLQRKPEHDSLTARTTAERVARRESSQKNRSAAALHERRKTGVRNAPARRKEPTDERNSQVATIAIISCSLVMVVAIVIFLVVLFNGSIFNKEEPLVAVPNLVGQEYETLGKISNFQIRLLETVYDPEVPAGKIIRQNPEAGLMVAKGNTIFVTVSKGAEPNRMKDVIGQEGSAVKTILESMSLKLRVSIQEEFSDVEQGCIIRTEPAADEELLSGQAVVLYVSKGPDMKTSQMPKLADMERESAVNKLNNQSMNLQIKIEEIYDSVIAAGRVVKTEPAEGEDITYGQEVTVYISKGPQTENMPNVIGLQLSTAIEMLERAGFMTHRVEQIESTQPKDKVIDQSIDPNELAQVNIEVVLYVSNGAQVELPQEVTVTHEFDLSKIQQEQSYTITIKLANKEIHKEIVSPETTKLSVQLTGSGVQYYDIYVNDIRQSWSERVDFNEA